MCLDGNAYLEHLSPVDGSSDLTRLSRTKKEVSSRPIRRDLSSVNLVPAPVSDYKLMIGQSKPTPKQLERHSERILLIQGFR